MPPQVAPVQLDQGISMPGPSDIIQYLGGDAQAFMILALMVAVVALWRRSQVIQDGRLDDLRQANKAHFDLSREMQRTLDALEKAIRGRNG